MNKIAIPARCVAAVASKTTTSQCRNLNADLPAAVVITSAHQHSKRLQPYYGKLAINPAAVYAIEHRLLVAATDNPH